MYFTDRLKAIKVTKHSEYCGKSIDEHIREVDCKHRRLSGKWGSSKLNHLFAIDKVLIADNSCGVGFCLTPQGMVKNGIGISYRERAWDESKIIANLCILLSKPQLIKMN